MAMAQGTASVKGGVYGRSGLPIVGAVLGVDLRPQGFDYVTEVTTGPTGDYAIAGLPGAPTGLDVPVVVRPFDANGDGLADYASLTRHAATFPGAASLLDIDLRAAAMELILLTSDVDDGTHPVGAPIKLTFNRPVDPLLTTVALYDATAGRSTAVTTAVDATGEVLTVSTSGLTPLAAYHHYTLSLSGVATNGSTLTVYRTFTAVSPSGILPPVSGLTVTPALADFDSTSFTLAWTAVTNAVGYRLYARDTSGNPTWLLMREVGSAPAPSASVTLPGSFDYYTGDAMQTPFAFGVKVDFAVVAVDASGAAADPSTATAVRRADTVPPTVEQALQAGNPNNAAGTAPRTITLAVTFSEYMDSSVLPTIALPNPAMTASFAWKSSLLGGTFSIMVPAGVDGTGAYSITGAKDTSGNLMTPSAGTLLTAVQLVAGGGFETGTLGTFTATYTGSSTAPVATSTTAATGTWSAQIGNASGLYQWGYSTLTSPVVSLPTGYTSLTASVAYRPYSPTTAIYDYSECYVASSTGTWLASILYSSGVSPSVFGTATANITSLAGQAVKIVCRTYQYGGYTSGMYVDDVSIVATP